jgi:G:T-mismatch repair DNA endonuclease (very short patch repair protein)
LIQVEKIINLYLNNNLSILDIGKKFNLGYKKVRNILLKNNVKLRKRNTKGLHKASDETKYKMSQSKIGDKNPNFNKKVSDKQIEFFNDMRLKLLADPIRKKLIYEKAAITRIKKGLSKGEKNPMSNPENIKKWTKSNKNTNPNKKELQLFNIINNLYPDKYKLNTKADIVIENKIPDIINIEDKNIIEMYGDYWHRNDSVTDCDNRIKLFEKCGYRTSIVWEHELKNECSLIEKIIKFHNCS